MSESGILATDAEIVQVAKAVCYETQNHGWSIGGDVIVERSYADFRVQLEQLDVTRIDVVPFDDKPTLATRSKYDWPCETDLLIRRRLTRKEQDTEAKVDRDYIDQLMRLVQDVFLFFGPSQPTQSGRQLTQLTNAIWLPQSQIVFHYVREHLVTMRQFTGLVRVAYKLQKAIE